MRKKYYERFVSGDYSPRNPQKYRGKYPIHYRSSLELNFCRFCDNQPNILYWGIESAIVPYYDRVRKTQRNYLIDFTMYVKDKTGQVKKYYIEIKPQSQTLPPVKGKKKESSYLYECITYATNIAKWESALKFAKSKGAEFKIITEKDIRS